MAVHHVLICCASNPKSHNQMLVGRLAIRWADSDARSLAGIRPDGEVLPTGLRRENRSP
jgi:hypothetical protein